MITRAFTWLLLVCFAGKAAAQQTIDTSIRAVFHQNIQKNEQEEKVNNLFLLGKLWGFLKYFHPNIAAGKFNWDKELLAFLPAYAAVSSPEERNDLLEKWLDKFGIPQACASCNDSLLTNARLRPDFTWINEKNFSPALAYNLLFIKDNRLEGDQYYIKFGRADGINFLQFRNESSYTSLEFPSDGYALLSLFKFWNAIEYWYPYKYGMPVKWDDVLKSFIPKMLAHKDGKEYVLAVEELVSAIHDSHGFFRSGKAEEILGKYYMPFTVKMIEEKLVVSSVITDSLKGIIIKKGDIIESIDDIPVNDWVKKYAKFCPASNTGSLYNKLSYWLTRSTKDKSRLKIMRNGKAIDITAKNYVPKLMAMPDLNPPLSSFQKDSAFCIVGENIGYINVGRFERKDSLELEAMIGKTKSLIIDNRQNQDEQKGTGGGDIIAGLILPPDNNFLKLSYPQPSYPGVFSLTEPINLGQAGSENYYRGNIIILVNEGTQSVGELLTMAYQKAPKAKVLGTTTAGADGNVTYIMLPGGIFVQFTGLGVYYADGSETQRVGIQPSIVVKQTIAGFRNGHDDQLDAAIAILSQQK